MDKVSIPTHWDENQILLLDEFCALLGIPESLAVAWQSRGQGPRWTRFQGTGRQYVTVGEARRFVSATQASRPGGGRDG